MKIYDISMSISPDMPVYKGKPAKRPVFAVDTDFSSGNVYESRLTMNMHTGTHIDSPKHILENGDPLEPLALEKVVTRCRVLDLTHIAEKISQQDLRTKPIAADSFVLLKTQNSFGGQALLEGDYIYLDPSGAAYLRDKRVIGVGIDALGIERAQPGHETHKLLMKAGIVIMEGLQLQDVPEDEYLLVAAPLKVIGVEAAPVRALLIKEEGLL